MKVILSGGGTGGHVFPAIAIANAIMRKYPDSEILFIGAKDKMEMTQVPKAGYKIEGLWISGFQRKLTLKNLLFPIKLICSLIKAKKIIKRFKPDIVIGVGGFASGPTLKMAASMKIPTLIQEQNSYPGVTNKLLANKANKICVAYENMERWFSKEKTIFTGNPIRQKVIDISNKKAAAQKEFNLEDKLTILVVGGSLGARTINQSIHQGLDYFEKNNIQVLWQTGRYYFPTANEAVGQTSYDGVKVFEFIYDMDLAYAAADIIISRAGAIAISELSCIGKPIILVPSPNVAEDHQTKNAMALSEKNAAIMVKDIDANKELIATLDSLINDRSKQEIMRTNISDLGVKDADDRILEAIEKLIMQ